MRTSLAPAPVRVAVTGAGGQFARTMLSQCGPEAPVRASVLCDLDVDRLVGVVRDLGLGQVSVCRSREDVTAAASAGITAVVPDVDLLDPVAYDVLVEATGHVPTGIRAARAALESRRHVVMVSKETESVAGPYLADIARANGVVHTTGEGDQPANLVDLVDWARQLGLEVVAAGKAAEYDVVLDHGTGQVTHPSASPLVPGLVDVWHLGDDVPGTVALRGEMLGSLALGAAADPCEMAVVANITGLLPDVPEMHYPVARVTELADVYALREHGGLLGRSGVLDVFAGLRRPDEASVAGGVFVVVRCSDAVSWEILAAKGHVVSADRRYACLYRPYHLMGVETVRTVVRAARDGVAAGVATGAAAVMAARVVRPLMAGSLLAVRGHHHEIDGVEPVLLPLATPEAAGAAPYYLADGARLRRNLEPGDLVALDELTGVDPVVLDAWRHAAAASTASPRSAHA